MTAVRYYVQISVLSQNTVKILQLDEDTYKNKLRRTAITLRTIRVFDALL